MSLEAKIDKVLEQTKTINDRLLLSEERYKVMSERMDTSEERHEKSESFQIKISTERSNIITVAKFCGWAVGICSVVGGGIAFVIMIINFIANK